MVSRWSFIMNFSIFLPSFLFLLNFFKSWFSQDSCMNQNEATFGCYVPVIPFSLEQFPWTYFHFLWYWLFEQVQDGCSLQCPTFWICLIISSQGHLTCFAIPSLLASSTQRILYFLSHSVLTVQEVGFIISHFHLQMRKLRSERLACLSLSRI